MAPYWEQDNNFIYHGHVLDVLKSMASESVQMCVTSPPYWGLRDYGLEPQIWDGDDGCEHIWGIKLPAVKESHTNEDFAEYNKANYRGGGHKAVEQSQNRPDNAGQFCQLCNAWRGSLGLEPTPELFIQHIVQIFREVKRVLRKDGTLWLNLGDSYWGGKGKSSQAWSTENQDRETIQKPQHQITGLGETRPSDGKHEILKPKDLCMIPARVALALQADGWWLRSDIIWSKPNPMPESVTDRPTKAHEHLFFLSKSQKYFYDAEAIREPYTEPLNRWGGSKLKEETTKHSKYLNMQKVGSSSALRANREIRPNPNGRNKRTVWTIEDHTLLIQWLIKNHPEIANEYFNVASDVWFIPTAPFSGAHFAVFPEKLIESCILAGSPGAGIVLDPFFGAGTTGIVANKYGRYFIGIDLSETYLKDIAIPRIEKETAQLKLFN